MPTPELKCFICNGDDKDKVYLPCFHEGREKVVCTRCLPMLIHGKH